MIKTTNPVTGNPVIVTVGVLDSVSDRIFKNQNGTQLRIVGVKVKDSKNPDEVKSGIMNERNFAHGVELGKSYQTRVERIPGGEPLITVSHLPGTSRATDEDFAWEAPASIVETVAPKNLTEIISQYKHDDGTPIGSRSKVPVNQVMS